MIAQFKILVDFDNFAIGKTGWMGSLRQPTMLTKLNSGMSELYGDSNIESAQEREQAMWNLKETTIQKVIRH